MAEIEFTDRYQALGLPYPDPLTMCQGQCEGTGMVPVYMRKGDERSQVHGPDETDPGLIALWEKAEEVNIALDGWHFVVCPDCNGTGKRVSDG